jgi:hypothetical protein
MLNSKTIREKLTSAVCQVNSFAGSFPFNSFVAYLTHSSFKGTLARLSEENV